MAQSIVGLLVFLGIIILAPVLAYNSLVFRRNGVRNAFGGMDAMLKKRYDLIPNLVAAVQTYMKHEKELLTQITELRSRATSGKLDAEETMKVDRQMSKALAGFMVAVENYPQLRSNENFLQLQGSLNEVEEQIAASRRSYNASVMAFNNALEMFPGSLIARFFSFERARMFEATEEERRNPDVKALFKA